MKGLIDVKNNGSKCFHWCHIRYLNPLKMHPERITKEDKNMVNDLDYADIKFLVSKKDYCKINVFCYENNLVYPFHVSNQKFEDCVDLLLITDKISHTLCILKILTDLCVITQNVGLKNTFANIVYNVSVVEKY